jgi:hypothetical protein
VPDSKVFLRERSRELISLPVLRAFFLQTLALILIYLLLQAAWRLIGLQLTLPVAALLQGSVAAGLSWRRLPSWWLPIQFILPPALVGAQQLALPSWIFLAAFLVLLALYWTTFRTRVPYYPSGHSAWTEVADLLPSQALRVIDIGSGFGGLAFFLARQRPGSQVAGIEIAPLPWAVSVVRAAWRRRRGEAVPRFARGDYQRLNFADYDVIFAYLSPAAMPALWAQASVQMRPGTLLLSYEFEIPGRAPHFTSVTGSGRRLYGWRI